MLAGAGAAYSKYHNPDPATKAFALLRRHDCKSAETEFSALIRDYPGDQRAYQGRGEARVCIANYDGAIADYTEAITRDPKWFDYFGRGIAYKATGQPDQALKDFDSAIAQEPKVPAPYIYRGIVLDSEGRTGAAHDDFSHVLKLLAERPRMLNFYAWTLATSPVAAYRDGPAAVQYATAACDWTSWKAGYVLDTLAAAYARDGKFDQAVKWQRVAVETTGAKDHSVFSERLELYENRRPYCSVESSVWF